MRIWVDADSCPVPLREIICKAAMRTQTLVTFVANQPLPIKRTDFTQMLQVEKGFDVADNEIVKRASAGELVITNDIPLASEVIENEVEVINMRGEKLTKHNIGQRLNMRDFMDTLRSSGIETGKNAAFSNTDKQEFANQLDRFLARIKK
ncbi:MAG: YaiI/YqxD family protein [Alteromonadaceae bacterium]|nr:YaiI/YqxD family protein [Alteromonadaceae bacterium]